MSDARVLAMNPPARLSVLRVGVVASLAATGMLFASLVSAYLVRRSLPDWEAIPDRRLGVLLVFAGLASLGVELGSKTGASRRVRLGGSMAVLGSALYLLLALEVLRHAIVTPPGLAAPHSAFLMLLLGVHVLHALAGGTFAILLRRAAGGSDDGDVRWALRVVAHFLFGLLAVLVFVLLGLK